MRPRGRGRASRRRDSLHGRRGGAAIRALRSESHGEHAGVQVPVNGLAAARFDLTLVDPENVIGLYVIAETATNRSIRWRWGLDPAAQQFGFSGPVTLVPGYSAHRFVFAGSTASAGGRSRVARDRLGEARHPRRLRAASRRGLGAVTRRSLVEYGGCVSWGLACWCSRLPRAATIIRRPLRTRPDLPRGRRYARPNRPVRGHNHRQYGCWKRDSGYMQRDRCHDVCRHEPAVSWRDRHRITAGPRRVRLGNQREPDGERGDGVGIGYRLRPRRHRSARFVFLRVCGDPALRLWSEHQCRRRANPRRMWHG